MQVIAFDLKGARSGASLVLLCGNIEIKVAARVRKVT